MDKGSDREVGHAGHIFGAASAVLVALCCIVLTVLYLIGDVNLLGETITIFPPVVWVVPLLAIAALTVFARSWRWAVFALLSVALFVGVSEDYRSLYRTRIPLTTKQGVRLITWNVAGRSDVPQMLAELSKLQPDILFFQESPGNIDALSSATASGYWKGFQFYNGGDCSILSRYQLQPIVSESVGPWDKPAMASAAMPAADGSTQTLLLCNVRLILPHITTDAVGWFTDEAKRVNSHKMRLDQYSKLARLFQNSGTHDGVILGGDFNVRGNSASLSPLKKAGVMDVWQQSGQGWGGTVLSDFPMARIDQVWMSDGIIPHAAQAKQGQVSDHRMVVVDFGFYRKGRGSRR